MLIGLIDHLNLFFLNNIYISHKKYSKEGYWSQAFHKCIRCEVNECVVYDNLIKGSGNICQEVTYIVENKTYSLCGPNPQVPINRYEL